ncbi:hypothetical protein, conserved in T. vivax, partial [Trypanosoma vivax Y486]
DDAAVTSADTAATWSADLWDDKEQLQGCRETGAKSERPETQLTAAAKTAVTTRKVIFDTLTEGPSLATGADTGCGIFSHGVSNGQNAVFNNAATGAAGTWGGFWDIAQGTTGITLTANFEQNGKVRAQTTIKKVIDLSTQVLGARGKISQIQQKLTQHKEALRRPYALRAADAEGTLTTDIWLAKAKERDEEIDGAAQTPMEDTRTQQARGQPKTTRPQATNAQARDQDTQKAPGHTSADNREGATGAATRTWLFAAAARAAW